MALTSIIRKLASSLTTLASQLVRGQGNYHCALFTAITHSSLSPLVPNLHYYSVSNKHSSDETLLPVIQSKIQCLQETDGHDRVSLFFIFFGGGLWAVWLLRKCGKVKRKWNLYGFFL